MKDLPGQKYLFGNTYVLSVQNAGTHDPALFWGSRENCQKLADACLVFSKDVIKVEMWDEDTMDVVYKWLSPFWN